MTKKEEGELRDELFNQRQVIDLLARRMIHGENGVSSNAMLAEALVGVEVHSFDYPNDMSDLARCLQTWLDAPQELRTKMLWRLAQYTSHISEQRISLA